ncbi:MAG: endo-1,4-beta-xylanase [Bacteroidetes bacterium]|nr:endo-1,4-beta-xylanase [Bacteroidota bacterium]
MKIISYNQLIIISLNTILMALCSGCSPSDIPGCEDSTGLYEYASYPVGVAIDLFDLQNDTIYRNIAIRQFNSITPENIFKAAWLHPEENTFAWTEADQLAYFCSQYGKRLHGHTLIWHEDLPSWIVNFQGNSADWEELFKSHIQTIVTHFKDKVKAWDVVNEAFNEDGTLRNTIWKQKVGSAYIEKAFRYTHEADPDVLLFYNDVNLEQNAGKRKAVLVFLNDLRNRGITIDGIGLQMHVNIIYPEISQMVDAMKDVADNKYLVHLSELDISVNPYSKQITPSHSLLVDQAILLGKIIQNYNQIPSKFRYGVTFWGISDKNSWIPGHFNRTDYPLLYDGTYSPKPAYCLLKESL